MTQYGKSYDERLIKGFYAAAVFLVERVKNDGWVFSSNYLREHVRCATGLRFTNSVSPEILREVIRRYPELRHWIDIKPLKAA